MKVIAITGATGFVGSRLQDSLREDGCTPVPVVRSTPADGEMGWSIDEGSIDREALARCDAVVHLAGEPLVAIRWTEEKKRRILESRRDGTRLIASAMASIDDGPRVLVCASGVDYYGDRGDEIVDESSDPGTGFLSEVVQIWERSADPAREAGIRVVHTRFGLILDARGGVLAKMLPAFKMGVGGPIASGTQWFPWIAIDDAVRAIRFCLDRSEIRGPVNVVAPNAVTNGQFTEALGRALHRPTALKLPSFAVKLAMGEMGAETLLTGQRVHPQRFLDAGFVWHYPDLDSALAHLLGHATEDPHET